MLSREYCPCCPVVRTELGQLTCLSLCEWTFPFDLSSRAMPASRSAEGSSEEGAGAEDHQKFCRGDVDFGLQIVWYI